MISLEKRTLICWPINFGDFFFILIGLYKSVMSKLFHQPYLFLNEFGYYKVRGGRGAHQSIVQCVISAEDIWLVRWFEILVIHVWRWWDIYKMHSNRYISALSHVSLVKQKIPPPLFLFLLKITKGNVFFLFLTSKYIFFCWFAICVA